MGQDGFNYDKELIKNRLESKTISEKKDILFLEGRSNRFLARYNPARITLSGMMFVYQRYLSPQLPSECLYHPSCSSFSKSLISEYGLIKGVVATADRLIRCNRVAVLDIHPLLIDEDKRKVKEDVGIYRRGEQ